MKDQAERMKAMYKAQTPTEHAKKHQDWKAKRAPSHDKINEMVAESCQDVCEGNFPDSHENS